MKTSATILFMLVVIGCTEGPRPPAKTPATRPNYTMTVDFENDLDGKAPVGFTTALTGGGGPAKWIIETVATATKPGKVLAQTSSDRTDYRFPLCIYDKVIARDVAVAVDFKTVSGKVDQAAGLVVRYRDKDNYYIVRANALEDNVRLYKVEKGQRRQLAGIDVKVSPAQWHNLSLTVVGSHLEVSMDDIHLFGADDQTFSEPGKVGLWTKADSVTRFDNFSISNRDAK
jgi:hypothetical protein